MKVVKLKSVFLIYVFLLLVFAGMILFYTFFTLKQYESMRPETKAMEAINYMVEESEKENFFEVFFPQRKEIRDSIKQEYLSLLREEELELLWEKQEGERISYIVRCKEVPLARIELKSLGEEETKLLVLQFRDWEVEKIEGILETVPKELKVSNEYTVKVNGKIIDKEGYLKIIDKDYEMVKDYISNVPEIIFYDLELLGQASVVEVYDQDGNLIPEGKNKNEYLKKKEVTDSLPKELEEKVDPLSIAKQWSLFMSNDLPFSTIKSYIVEDSYQYNVAKEYAVGVDISFTSEHTLANPAFTEEKIQNIVWLTEDCFSVDISFTKHMIVGLGKRVDDHMNDRFYFVRGNISNEMKEQSEWKLVGMKEIVDNEK